jgi:hypothetical protein
VLLTAAIIPRHATTGRLSRTGLAACVLKRGARALSRARARARELASSRAGRARAAQTRHAGRAPRPMGQHASNDQSGLRMHVPRLKLKMDSLFVTKMLAMALLLQGGLLGGAGGETRDSDFRVNIFQNAPMRNGGD